MYAWSQRSDSPYVHTRSKADLEDVARPFKAQERDDPAATLLVLQGHDMANEPSEGPGGIAELLADGPRTMIAGRQTGRWVSRHWRDLPWEVEVRERSRLARAVLIERRA